VVERLLYTQQVIGSIPIPPTSELAALKRARSLLAALAVGLALTAASRRACGQAFIDFPIGMKTPEAIAAGPDGNVWFANYLGYSIGRMTPQGVFTDFPTPTGVSTDVGIALGADGNLWFTEWIQSKVGRITPQGAITEFPTPGSENPFLHHAPLEIASGPDGNLWFTEAVGNVARITTAGVITEFPVTSSAATLNGICSGPDGKLWFTEVVANKIGRMTTTGAVVEYPLPTPFAQPRSITAGPDGNLWFTEGPVGKIGRITTAGAVTEFTLPANSYPYAICVGPEGSLWFAQFAYPSIGRITTAGVSTLFPLPLAAGTLTVGIATGPDGNLWLSEDNASTGDRIGRFTPPPVAPPLPGFHTLSPCRAVDTRGPVGPYGAPALAAGGTREFLMAGECRIPSSAKAVSLNVTVTQSTGSGSLTFFAGGTSRPDTLAIAWSAGQTRANNAIVAVGADGEIAVFCGQASGTVELIVDVNGYFD
jgi:streptogramin lyase